MKNKGLVAIGAIAIIIVLAVYLIFSITLGSWNPSKWEFSEQPQAEGEESDKPNEPTGNRLQVAMLEDGQALYGGGKYEMPESVTFIRVKEDAGTHITTSGVIMMPRTRQAGEWVWTVKFLNAGSEWAADKNVNEYIELTAAEGEENADGVNVNILNPFGEPIVLKAALKDSEVLNECRLEYLSSATMQNIQHVSAFYDGVTFTTDIAYGEGTVKGECEFKSARIGFDSEFEDRLTKELSYVKLGGYTFNKTKAWTADSWGNTYEFCADYELDYFMFVKNFYTLTESQKFAVVKSWGTAPTLLDMELTYSYKGAAVASIIDSDVAGNSIESFVELWQQPGEQTPDDKEPTAQLFKIDYGTVSDGVQSEEITLNCPPNAQAGETVSFTVTAAIKRNRPKVKSAKVCYQPSLNEVDIKKFI